MQMKLKLTVAAAIAAVAGIASRAGRAGRQDRPRRPDVRCPGPLRQGQRERRAHGHRGPERAGLTIGGKKIKFEIQAEDDAADPKQGTAAAQKLCDAKVAGVVGHLNSGTTIPASKVYNDCGIPHVTGAATNPDLTKPGYKTTYRIIANDNALGAGLALLRRRHAQAEEGRHHRRPHGLRPGRCRSVQEDRAESKGMQVVDAAVHDRQGHRLHGHPDVHQVQEPRRHLLRRHGPAGRPDAAPDGAARPGATSSTSAATASAPPRSSSWPRGAKTLDNVVCAEGGASLAKMPGGTAWKAQATTPSTRASSRSTARTPTTPRSCWSTP